jgi:hypothetical protein
VVRPLRREQEKDGLEERFVEHDQLVIKEPGSVCAAESEFSGTMRNKKAG